MVQTMETMRDVTVALDKIFGPRHGFQAQHRLPDLGQLKKAFRRQSLRLHPDRAQTLGVTEALLTEEFKAMHDAYRLLLPFITGPRPRFVFPRTARPERPSPETSSADFFWKVGRLPPIRLRFAQFLYYRGLISFKTMIRAIVWQTRQRPRTGELALKLGALSRESIGIVLKHKKIREPFLSAAVRLGLLNAASKEKILAAQRSFNRPIGAYFIKEGILTPARLDDLLAECERHNQTQTQ
jgi:hypothetical protein